MRATLPEVGLAPDRRAALELLSDKMNALLNECGSPSYRKLKQASWRLAPASLSDVLNARSAPKLEFMVDFVIACLAHADTLGLAVNAESRDVAGWEALWLETNAALKSLRLHKPGPLRTPAEQRPQPRQLPIATRGFVGRSEEMQWLDDNVLSASSDEFVEPRIALVSGMAGVGKSSLVVTWGHRHRADFPDGQLYADLGGYGRGAPASSLEVLGRFLRALDVDTGAQSGSLEAMSALLRTALAERELLLLLDNAASSAQVKALLPGTSGCAVVVTSRSALPALAVGLGAPHLALLPLPLAEARRLLVGRARVHLDTESLNELAQLCGRLPLALRLVAHRLEVSDTAKLLADIRGHADRLAALERGVEEESVRLSSVFSWSLSHLSESERRAFRILSRHPGPDLDATAASSYLGVPAVSAERLIHALTNFSLMSPTLRGRTQMHSLLASWGRSLPSERTEVDAALDRAFAYYLHGVDVADRALLPQRGRPSLGPLPEAVTLPHFGGRAQAKRWLATELDNIMAVIRLAASTGRDDVTCLLPSMLLSYFNLTKPWSEWIESHQIGIAAARRSNDHLQLGHLSVGLGIALRETGERLNALEALTEGRDAYRKSNEPTGEAMALNNLAIVLDHEGRRAEAIEALAEATCLVDRHSDPWRASILRHNLAEAELRLDRLDEALAHAEEARTLATEAGDEAGAATTLTTVAHIHALTGAAGLAETEFTEALSAQRRAGDLHGQAITRHLFGKLLLNTGRQETALEHLSAAIDILDSLGAPDADLVRKTIALAKASNARSGLDCDGITFQGEGH